MNVETSVSAVTHFYSTSVILNPFPVLQKQYRPQWCCTLWPHGGSICSGISYLKNTMNSFSPSSGGISVNELFGKEELFTPNWSSSGIRLSNWIFWYPQSRKWARDWKKSEAVVEIEKERGQNISHFQPFMMPFYRLQLFSMYILCRVRLSCRLSFSSVLWWFSLCFIQTW